MLLRKNESTSIESELHVSIAKSFWFKTIAICNELLIFHLQGLNHQLFPDSVCDSYCFNKPIVFNFIFYNRGISLKKYEKIVSTVNRIKSTL